MRLFDTHAHIGLIYDDTIERMLVVRTAYTKGVEAILSVTNNLVDFNNVYNDLKNECLAIGSLPNTNVDEAMSIVKTYYYDLPFCPQLPKLSKKEDMRNDRTKWQKDIRK